MKVRPFPTLLHPGIGGGSLSLWPLSRRLRKAGIHVERCRSPLVLTRDVAHYASRLRRRVHRLFVKCGRPITLFGWSMGGLIAVDAMRDPVAASMVRRIITFGTPFDGSWPAYVAAHRPGQLLLKAPKEIIPGSATLDRLQSLINDPDRSWEIVTINGPPYLDPFAPAPLKLIEPDRALMGPFGHAAPLAHRGLHRLVSDLVLTTSLTTAF